METAFEILNILLVILAATGLIAMIAILVTLVIIKDGGMLILGYEDDEETIKVQKGNDTE